MSRVFLRTLENPSRIKIASEWVRLEQSHSNRPVVLVASTFSADPIRPYLGWWLAQFGINVDVRPFSLHQIDEMLLNSSGELRQGNAVAKILLLRAEDIFADFDQAARNWDAFLSGAKVRIAQLARRIADCIPADSAIWWVSNLPCHSSWNAPALQENLAEWYTAVHAELNLCWMKAIQSIPGAFLFDFNTVLNRFGVENALDPTLWLLARVPYSEKFYAVLGKQLARVVRASLRAPKKAMVVDCDNVLWGGVIGEDELSGIALGGDAPGNAYCQLQRYLLDLRARGILLCLCSKNNETDVWEVFERHPEMLLKKEDFAAVRINWKSKAENLLELAAELNISVEDLVLIDDEAVEIAEVNSRLPNVLAIQLPEEPSVRVNFLSQLWAFDSVTLTAEDRRRSDMLLQEQERKTI
ncbi:MAG TPA: HAD-IIIC family phosphatase, partial [Acidobacteriota bacterium]